VVAYLLEGEACPVACPCLEEEEALVDRPIIRLLEAGVEGVEDHHRISFHLEEEVVEEEDAFH
jgi:hypothetical protein